jgi:transcriptional regulator with XRE-family HTH domain
MERITSLNWAIAETVRNAREARGLTQGQLAGFAGISDIYLSELERGGKGASLNVLLLIAKVLEMKVSELVRQIEDTLENGPPAPLRKRGRPRKEL